MSGTGSAEALQREVDELRDALEIAELALGYANTRADDALHETTRIAALSAIKRALEGRPRARAAVVRFRSSSGAVEAREEAGWLAGEALARCRPIIWAASADIGAARVWSSVWGEPALDVLRAAGVIK